MMNKIYWIAIVLLLFSFTTGHAKNKKVKLNWNKTDRPMPAFVRDSILTFYKSIDMDNCVFFLYGKGLHADKSSLDGIYSFKKFSSHSYAHLLVMYKNEVQVIKSVDCKGIVEEVCSYAQRKGIYHAFFKEMSLACFYYLIDELQAVYYRKNGPKVLDLSDRDKVINYIVLNTRKDLVYDIYMELRSTKNVEEELPNTIITKELDENETILLLGLIGGYNLAERNVSGD